MGFRKLYAIIMVWWSLFLFPMALKSYMRCLNSLKRGLKPQGKIKEVQRMLLLWMKYKIQRQPPSTDIPPWFCFWLATPEFSRRVLWNRLQSFATYLPFLDNFRSKNAVVSPDHLIGKKSTHKNLYQKHWGVPKSDGSFTMSSNEAFKLAYLNSHRAYTHALSHTPASECCENKARGIILRQFNMLKI